MPELPEVETIRKGLEKYLKGHKIERVEVKSRKILPEDENLLVGGEIKNARRFGKVLVIDLDNGYSVVIHIKLTGQLVYRGPNLEVPPPLSRKIVDGIPGKHTHIIFYLDKGGLLYYNDLRRFGWMKVVKRDEVEKVGFIEKLGPEPLDGLTLENFREIVHAGKVPIKVLLMDQEKIGGVGNIYANDALWLSKIDPRRKANTLTDAELVTLYKAIEEVLKRGLEHGGASELAYVHVEGDEGGYQKFFLVYGQDGNLCQRCKNAKIQKIRLGGRGTYFCPNCQK